MVPKGAVGHGRLPVGTILGRMKRMVEASDDKRATALAELKDTEDGDPFKILIGTILSHRTRDENTSRASANLFARFRNAEELASADVDEVKRLIKPAGFYNMKAKNVVRVAGQLVQEFGGRVPDEMDGLLKLHSVGRKTANCVLVYGFNKPAIPVDTHVHRISNRLGLVETKTPEETELALCESVPRRYWLELNDVFVRFGQTTCKPIGPKCGICTLKEGCLYYEQAVKKKSGRELVQRASVEYAPSRPGRSPGRARMRPSRS